MPAVAPSGVGENEYYNTDEEYFHAVGDALHEEYQVIVDAGFILQIDDPFLSDLFGDPSFDARAARARAEIYIEALNASLPASRRSGCASTPATASTTARASTRRHSPTSSGYMLRMNAGAYCFEAANARHEHEYHLWET